MEFSHKKFKLIMIAFISICLALISIWIYLGYSSQGRMSITLIPKGYVGLVKIVYDMRGTPEIPIKNGKSVFKIPSNGLIYTSSQLDSRWGTDEYYYYEGEKLWRLRQESDPYNTNELPLKIMIWGRSVTVEDNEMFESFFVGDQEQYNHYEKQPTDFRYKK